MKLTRLLLTATMLSGLAFSASAQEQEKETKQITNPTAPVTRGEFQNMLRDALMEEPEMIMKAVNRLRDKMEEENKRATAESFAKYKLQLQNDKLSPQIGSKNPDVTIILFFDYHCGFCKKLLPTITQLINEDKNVRVIFREYPILSEDSVSASRAALAVNRIAPEKYFAYHSELMKAKGSFSEEALLSMAGKIGVNTDKLKKEMDNQVITDILSKNREIGEELGVRGTPALFVGEKMLPGAVPYDTLKRIVGEVRSEKTGNKTP